MTQWEQACFPREDGNGDVRNQDMESLVDKDGL
jgi:hypothetical protein